MNNVSQYEKIFRALGDSHRLNILEQLKGREMNAGEILATVDVVQSTLSHHMKTLCDAGLVNARRNGKWTCYTINEPVFRDAQAMLDVLAAGGLPAEDGGKGKTRTAQNDGADKTRTAQNDGADKTRTAQNDGADKTRTDRDGADAKDSGAGQAEAKGAGGSGGKAVNDAEKVRKITAKVHKEIIAEALADDTVWGSTGSASDSAAAETEDSAAGQAKAEGAGASGGKAVTGVGKARKIASKAWKEAEEESVFEARVEYDTEEIDYSSVLKKRGKDPEEKRESASDGQRDKKDKAGKRKDRDKDKDKNKDRNKEKNKDKDKARKKSGKKK